MTAESPLYNTTLERFTLDSSTSTQVYCRWREINTCGSVRSKRAVLSRFQSMFRVCFISAPDTLSRFAITSRTSFWRFCDVTSRRCHLGAIYSRLNCVDFLLHWEIFEQDCREVRIKASLNVSDRRFFSRELLTWKGQPIFSISSLDILQELSYRTLSFKRPGFVYLVNMKTWQGRW